MRRFSELHIPAHVVNTPRETGYGCGISIEVTPACFGRAAVLTGDADGFRGWWAISETTGACTRL